MFIKGSPDPNHYPKYRLKIPQILLQSLEFLSFLRFMCYDLITVLSKPDKPKARFCRGSPKVTSHLVQRPNTTWGRVCEEAAVQHHCPTEQVEPQEHGQSQDDLQLCLWQCHAGLDLQEVGLQTHWIRMNGHRCQLQDYQSQTVRCHGNPPILCTNIMNVELPGGSEECISVQAISVKNCAQFVDHSTERTIKLDLLSFLWVRLLKILKMNNLRLKITIWFYYFRHHEL